LGERRPYPFRSQMAKVELRNRLKSPEGASNVASQGTEGHYSARFGPDIPAKSTLGALLKPLFRQFLDGVLGSWRPAVD
jgi:hypothetical protein